MKSPVQPPRPIAGQRFVGFDLGAETLKAVELRHDGTGWSVARRQLVDHGKKPGPAVQALLDEWDWPGVAGAAVCGRFSRAVRLPRVPTREAQARACRFLLGDKPATVISIGSHGFSVLELRGPGVEVFRENSRCSQGTGNFLRQLVERFALRIETAGEMCADVADPTPLSGRCPVILKTDMTHLANKGEDRARILAGLFDAVCENVLALVKPGLSPADVLLIGGVTRSRRVQRVFRERLAQRGMNLRPLTGDDALFCEALGAALMAVESGAITLPEPALLPAPPVPTKLERLPGLARHLGRVRRLKAPPRSRRNGKPLDLLLGLDIGSTGSKAVALHLPGGGVYWEGYHQTLGDPVGAAQALLREFVAFDGGLNPVLGFGVTGSGREIASSLLATCYGTAVVFVLNEIAAHAQGALHFDPRVDTIFEIGGQDAKYIRLADGRVIDCAMNEACSAGTGSFIEEQGRKFAGLADVVQLGQAALAAPCGVSLGQHCSVFMAEIIDEAVAAGVESDVVVAGLYDSIIQNYLHRVKGNRSVGRVIFCQGMPFAADALAAAVVRQTGSDVIIPPNPGTVGALGIALLAKAEGLGTGPGLDLARFLEARVERKETFVCHATVGCGPPGNLCRIDALRTVVADQRQRFAWGGACSLHDKGARKRKLPDHTPDPFRARAQLVQSLQERLGNPRGRRRVALGDEFALKGHLPLFATLLEALGCDLVFARPADQATLRRGIQSANVPFCAPLQLHHGSVGLLAQAEADLLFLPMLRSLPRVAGEDTARTCPMVQASPHLLRMDLRLDPARVLTPVIDFGAAGFDSPEFRRSCRQLAETLDVRGLAVETAVAQAIEAQRQFEAATLALGREALDFCRDHGVLPVVVLGRPYTIHNTVLNSNVPAILREQGALGIPVDCYPVAPETPGFPDVYWGHAQRILRAAHEVRRTPGLYSVYCSNYSCGPDSFNLHFYAYIMDGRPFAVIETDGHAGDAGTKTRIEAFLYCVEQDRRRGPAPASTPAKDFTQIRLEDVKIASMRRNGERVVLPLVGQAPKALAACLRGLGIAAETLPPADPQAVRLGRRHTSGKECLPMCMTLGGFLQRLEAASGSGERFVLGMPSCRGPCRFGVYNLLNRITLETLGSADRVRIWSPQDTNYFECLPHGLSALVFAGFAATDLLHAALLDVRPGEASPGRAHALYERYTQRLYAHLETEARGDLSLRNALWQTVTGRLFGVQRLLASAAADFAAVRGQPEVPPTVLLVGEIYARCNGFANDGLIEQLEACGLRVKMAPFGEWLEYADFAAELDARPATMADLLKKRLQQRIRQVSHQAMAGPLGWPDRIAVTELVAAAREYLPDTLYGEAVLTVGNALHEWRAGHIDGVVNVGPHECMPSKIAEAQFFHVAERERLPSLTLPLNGDPLDPEVLETFAFAVRRRGGPPST